MNIKNIDTIISMLLTKGHVRCDTDGFTKSDFDYIEKNKITYEKSYSNLNIERNSGILFESDEEDGDYYYDVIINSIQRSRKYLEYDLLINIKVKSEDQVIEIYGFDSYETVHLSDDDGDEDNENYNYI